MKVKIVGRLCWRRISNKFRYSRLRQHPEQDCTVNPVIIIYGSKFVLKILRQDQQPLYTSGAIPSLLAIQTYFDTYVHTIIAGEKNISFEMLYIRI
jgi:hypothetical protein